MVISFSQFSQFDCPKCRDHINFEIWLIVDISERPDLLDAIQQGNLHKVHCPSCGLVSQVDSPLLIFRHDQHPPVLYSPAQRGRRMQSEQQSRLIEKLHGAFNSEWQDTWITEGLLVVDRSKLPDVLREDVEQKFSPSQNQAPAKSTGLPPDFANDLTQANKTFENYGQTHDPKALDQAIGAWNRIFSHPFFGELPAKLKLNMFNSCGTVLFNRYKHSNAMEDLDSALKMWRRVVVANIPLDSQDLSMYVNNLNLGLSERYDYTRHIDDLEELIRVTRDLTTIKELDAITRSNLLFNLGHYLSDHYDRTEQMEDAEQEIQAYQQAIVWAPPDWPQRVGAFVNLAVCLNQKYSRSGSMETLDGAIRIYQEVLTIVPADYEYISICLTNLGNSLHERYRRLELQSDLDEAVQLQYQALEKTPIDSPNYPYLLNNLGNILYERHGRTGQISDLEESIRLHRLALQSTPLDSPNRHFVLHGLGDGLSTYSHLTGQLDYEEEAIQAWQQALSLLSRDSLERPRTLNSLGGTLSSRYMRTRLPEDLTRARQVWQEICTLTKDHLPEVLLTASRNWGNWALERQAWEEACQAFGYGLQAIQRLFENQLSRAGKEVWIREARGIPALAAHAFVKTGNLPAALEALESGRARQLGESLERARQDLERLADPTIGQHELLQRYYTASARYTNLSRMSSSAGSNGESAIALPPDWLQQLEVAQQEIRSVISEIRTVPGYQNFLRPATAGQVQEQAQSAPLAYITVTLAEGLVIIVTGDKIVPLELPGMTQEALHQQIFGKDGQSSYLQAYLDWRSDSYNDRKREAWKQALDATTHWLWPNVMQPLLSQLQSILPAGQQVILIPCGVLSILPLHAAWEYDDSRPCGRYYALDEFIFTYTPSALALIRLREKASSVPAEKLLVVENPDQSLHFSEPAAQAALALFRKKTHLPRNKATLDAVRAALADHNVLYFFTHGIARFDDPLFSALTLADQPLTIHELFNLKLEHARIAVLSACETGLPANIRLLEETVSLPTGLMQAGVPGVVGSLWTVLEASTAILMTIFFERWREEGLSAPEALRKAQITVRDAAYLTEAQNYFKVSLTAATMSPAVVADILHKQLRINDFDHPFYWAAFTYTGW